MVRRGERQADYQTKVYKEGGGITKKTPYQQAHEDINVILAELKIRKNWTDKDLGKYIGESGIKGDSVKCKRNRGLFPKMRFCDISLLLDLAGYDIKFVKREKYG